MEYFCKDEPVAPCGLSYTELRSTFEGYMDGRLRDALPMNVSYGNHSSTESTHRIDFTRDNQKASCGIVCHFYTHTLNVVDHKIDRNEFNAYVTKLIDYVLIVLGQCRTDKRIYMNRGISQIKDHGSVYIEYALSYRIESLSDKLLSVSIEEQDKNRIINALNFQRFMESKLSSLAKSNASGTIWNSE